MHGLARRRLARCVSAAKLRNRKYEGNASPPTVADAATSLRRENIRPAS